MTTSGQRNHYNVKLLRGYGISINVKDNRLILKNGQNDITGISEKEEWFISKIPYEKIVISGSADCFTGTVTDVIDGDTIEVEGIRIRLALTAAPELSEEFGIEAREFTTSLCPMGSTVLVDEDDGQTGGSYGRTIGKVYCGDILLNSALLDQGLAYIDERFCDESEFATEDWVKKYGC